MKSILEKQGNLRRQQTFRPFSGIALTVFLVFTLLLPSESRSETLSGSQIYVVDGDTINVNGNRIRLVGFDTPETYRSQCDYELQLGNMATARVRELVDGVARIELDLLPGRDRYNRLLGRLYVNGVDVSEILVGEGLARIYGGGRRQSWC